MSDESDQSDHRPASPPLPAPGYNLINWYLFGLRGDLEPHPKPEHYRLLFQGSAERADSGEFRHECMPQAWPGGKEGGIVGNSDAHCYGLLYHVCCDLVDAVSRGQASEVPFYHLGKRAHPLGLLPETLPRRIHPRPFPCPKALVHQPIQSTLPCPVV